MTPRANAIERAARAVLVVLACTWTAALPGGVAFPYVAPKAVLLHVGGALAAALLLLLATRTGPRAVLARGGALSAVVVATFVWRAVTAVAGVDPRRSSWGTPERGEGLVTDAALLALALLAIAVLRRARDWLPVARAVVASGSVVAVVALLQLAHVLPHVFADGERPPSTTGNSLFAGGATAVTVLVAVLLARVERHVALRRAAALAALVAGGGLVATESRGPLLALAAGAWLALAVWRDEVPVGAPRRRVATAAVVAAPVLAVLAGVAVFVPAARGLPLVRRLVPTDATAFTHSFRLHAWPCSLDAGLARPWTGWGPRCVEFAYDAHFDPSLLRLGMESVHVDHAHSVPLDVFVETGVPGVLLFGATYVFAYAALARALRRRRVPLVAAALGSGLLAALFVHGLTAFDDLGTAVVHALVLAAAATLGARRGRLAHASGPLPPTRVAAAVACGGVLVACALAQAACDLGAARRAHRAALAVAVRDPSAPRLLRDVLASASAHAHDLARTVAETVPTEIGEAPQSHADSPALLDAARDAARTALVASPRDTRAVRCLAAVATTRALHGGDRSGLQQAADALADAIERCPTRQDLRLALALVLYADGNVEAAIEWAEDAWTDDPAVGEAAWRYAWLVAVSGDTDDARAILDEAERAGAHFPKAAQAFVAQIRGTR